MAQGLIGPADARVYSAGRRHEIAFTNAALAMLACATTDDQRSVIVAGASVDHAEAAAARGVGLRVADYRTLVVRIDSALRASPPVDPALRKLDSLRVQLTVLRARMTARQAPPTPPVSPSQPRSTPCSASR